MEKRIYLRASDLAECLMLDGAKLFGFDAKQLLFGLGREVRRVGCAQQEAVQYYAPSAHAVRALLAGPSGRLGLIVSQQLGFCSSTPERQAVLAAANTAVAAIDAELARRCAARERQNATQAVPPVVVVKKEKESKNERYVRARALAAQGLAAMGR